MCVCVCVCVCVYGCFCVPLVVLHLRSNDCEIMKDGKKQGCQWREKGETVGESQTEINRDGTA